jgi:hypothetical protein
MNKQHWQDWGNVVLGLWIFGSPWLLEHAMVTEILGGGLSGMWNLWIVGLAVVAIALWAISAYKPWEEWTNATLGGWLVVSPWVLGFSQSTVLMWDAVISGALVVGLAAWTLVEAGGGPQKPATS